MGREKLEDLDILNLEDSAKKTSKFERFQKHMSRHSSLYINSAFIIGGIIVGGIYSSYYHSSSPNKELIMKQELVMKIGLRVLGAAGGLIFAGLYHEWKKEFSQKT